MLSWFREVDRILRGETTRPSSLSQRGIEVPLFGVSAVLILCGMAYGVCMGCYSVFRSVEADQIAPSYWQLVASIVKTPALFLLTLLITFPSLYVFNALVGSRLSLLPLLRLLIAALAVNMSVLAALGPIVAFFSVSTKSYSFMVLFNVVVFGVSGILGLMFLVQTLNRLTVAETAVPPPKRLGTPLVGSNAGGALEGGEPAIEAQAIEEPGALDPWEGHVLGRHVKTVFRCWIVLFGLVGAQMGWVLRPFIGAPNQPFQWFRERESNFFGAVWWTLVDLFR